MAKIMVVDDDKEFTTLYKEYLTMVGFEAIAENHSGKARGGGEFRQARSLYP